MYGRERLEREIREKMEEKRREQEAKLRESLIGRNPVWRDLRSAARCDSFFFFFQKIQSRVLFFNKNFPLLIS